MPFYFYKDRTFQLPNAKSMNEIFSQHTIWHIEHTPLILAISLHVKY